MKINPPRTDERNAAGGFSLLELLIAMTIIAIVLSIALPQLIASRRLQRLAALPRQVMTQMRQARQEAMSRRRAVTVQYDDARKQISVIVHQGSGPSVLTEPGYPNTAGSQVLSTTPLAVAGINASEINYGIPAGLPTGPLGDNTRLFAMAPGGRVNITFQPDGSVIDAAGQPADSALFFYNSQLPAETASAVSILGSAGRVKVWRYNRDANQYVE